MFRRPDLVRMLRVATASSAALMLAGPVHAAVVVHTVSINESASNGATNGNPVQFFSVDTTFDQFNTTLGTLNSATLSWDVTGHILVTSNMLAEAKLAYRSSFAIRNADSDGTPPNDVDFPFVGSEVLSLAGLSGVGTVDLGDFVGSVDQVAGFFPWSADLRAAGSVTLTYDYTPDDDPPTVPEPTTLALAGLALLGLRLCRRRG